MKRLLMVLLCAYTAAAWASDTAEMRRLVEQGAHEEAYALAKTLEKQEAGDPEFDFYFGLAALNAGKPDEAVFAFERVVLVEPKNYRAHLELGRALFLAGDLDASQARFEFVESINPPSMVQIRIEAFLDAIDKRRRELARNINGYVGFAMGNDDNVAAATKDDFLLYGLTVRLPSDVESLFSEWEAGAGLHWPFSKRSSLFGRASLRQRQVFSNQAYNLDIVGATVGWSYDTDENRYRLLTQTQLTYLDDARNRAYATVGGEWTHYFNSGYETTVFSQVGRADHRDEDLDQDGNIYIVGAGLISPPVGKRGIKYGGGFSLSHEDVDEGALEHLGKTQYSVRLLTQVPIKRNHAVYGVLRYQNAENNEDDVVFAEVRKDRLVSVDLGWNWKFADDWLLKAEYTWTGNESNLELYDYERNQFLLGVRYTFELL